MIHKARPIQKRRQYLHHISHVLIATQSTALLSGEMLVGQQYQSTRNFHTETNTNYSSSGILIAIMELATLCPIQAEESQA